MISLLPGHFLTALQEEPFYHNKEVHHIYHQKDSKSMDTLADVIKKTKSNKQVENFRKNEPEKAKTNYFLSVLEQN